MSAADYERFSKEKKKERGGEKKKIRSTSLEEIIEIDRSRELI